MELVLFLNKRREDKRSDNSWSENLFMFSQLTPWSINYKTSFATLIYLKPSVTVLTNILLFFVRWIYVFGNYLSDVDVWWTIYLKTKKYIRITVNLWCWRVISPESKIWYINWCSICQPLLYTIIMHEPSCWTEGNFIISQFSLASLNVLYLIWFNFHRSKQSWRRID